MHQKGRYSLEKHFFPRVLRTLELSFKVVQITALVTVVAESIQERLRDLNPGCQAIY